MLDKTLDLAKTLIEIGAENILNSTKRGYKQEENFPIKRRRLLLIETVDTGRVAIGLLNESNSESQTQQRVFGALSMPLQRLWQICIYLEFKRS